MLLDVICVEPPPAYRFLLEFENHEQKVFDLTPYLEIGVFRQLKNSSLFRAAHIDGGTVAWPGEIDIAPATLYFESLPVQASENVEHKTTSVHRGCKLSKSSLVSSVR